MSDINTLISIENWHAAARPDPDPSALSVQIGCHFEEVAELVDALLGDDERSDTALYMLSQKLKRVADRLKTGEFSVCIPPENREAVLDALCDQIVTSVGIGYCASLNVPKGCLEVNRSNWSKFVDDKPVFDANGKIAKGPDYAPPDLKGCY